MLTNTLVNDRNVLHADQLSTPTDFARFMTLPAILSTSDERWAKISLQRFQVPSFEINLAGSRVHRVTLHLGGPILIHRKRAGVHDQRWSTVGYTNVVPAQTPTSRSFSTPADFVVAYIEPDVVEEVAAEVFHGDPSRLELVESLAAQDDVVSRIVQLLLLEAESRRAVSRLLIDTLVRALSLHIVRSYSSIARKEMMGAIDRTDYRVRRAIDYMNANLSEDLSLGELAKAACLSASHFTRLFRGATGSSPHQYLVSARIDRARELLQYTSLSVTEIALRCGFEQAAHFATTFRKVCGQSPSAYRAERLG